MVKFCYTDINKLNKIFECASCIMVDSNIQLNSYGLTIKGMDPAHVSFIDIFIDRTDFKEWECEEELIIGINLKNLNHILGVSKEEDEVIFNYEKGGDIIGIEISNKIRRTEYELKLMTIESEVLEIPEIEYMTSVKMNSVQLNQILGELGVIIAKRILFMIEPSKVYMSAIGELGKSKVELGKKDEGEIVNTEDIEGKIKTLKKKIVKETDRVDVNTGDKIYNVSYSLVLLNKLKRASDISDKVTISLMEGVPMRLEWEISGESYIHYYIAPLIEE